MGSSPSTPGPSGLPLRRPGSRSAHTQGRAQVPLVVGQLRLEDRPDQPEEVLRELVGGEASGEVNAVVAEAMREGTPKSLGDLCDLYGKLLAANDGDEAHADDAREELRQVLRHPAGPTGFPWPKCG